MLGTIRFVRLGRKNLFEWMDFDSMEYSKYGIGVFPDKFLHVFPGVRLKDNQTPDIVGQGTGQDYPMPAVPAVYFFNMCVAMNLPPSLAVRSIEAENDELHCHVISKLRWEIVNIRRYGLDRGFFQRVPVLISKAYFVPPPDLRFAEFPTEVHDAPFEKKGKIA